MEECQHIAHALCQLLFIIIIIITRSEWLNSRDTGLYCCFNLQKGIFLSREKNTPYASSIKHHAIYDIALINTW